MRYLYRLARSFFSADSRLLKTYKGEIVLVLRHSPFNLLLLTEGKDGLRTLRFSEEGLRQSIVNKDDPEFLALPYAKILVQSLAFIDAPERLLVMGLGGGTLPRFFHKTLPSALVEVVEIDPGVLEVAREFCGFVEDDRLRAHIEDGRDFIERHEASYDVVVLDCFSQEAIPEHLLTLEFLLEVRKSLSLSGMAVANIWGRADNRLYEHMLLTYRAAFEQVYVLDVPDSGTKVFVALAQPNQKSREKIVAGLQQLAFRGSGPALPARWRHSDLENLSNGRVLRDCQPAA